MEAYEVVWPWVSCVSIGWCFDAAQKHSIFSWVKFSVESKKTSDRNNFMKLVPKTKSNGSSVSKSTTLVSLLLHDQKHKKIEMTDKVVMCLLPDQCWTLLVVAPPFVSSRVSSKCFELHLYTVKDYNNRVYWWSFPWSHPVFTLYLGVFSPPIPSLTEVQKVRKFY
jgi:hypothetical protein